jgi:hypothetical protein
VISFPGTQAARSLVTCKSRNQSASPNNTRLSRLSVERPLSHCVISTGPAAVASLIGLGAAQRQAVIEKTSNPELIRRWNRLLKRENDWGTSS